MNQRLNHLYQQSPLQKIHLNIRARLVLASVGILIIGFGILTYVAGSQIAAATRADYEARMVDTIQLVSRGVSPYISRDFDVNNPSEDLLTSVQSYENDLNGEISIFDIAGGGQTPGRTSYRDMPEIETAMRGEVVVVERQDQGGNATLYTATGIHTGPDADNPPNSDSTPDFGGHGGDNDGFEPIIIQLSVPLSALQAVIFQRWLVLCLVFLGVLIVSAGVALLVARSIINPLYALRESAIRLSHGDLDHRVEAMSKDEIGAVADAFNEMATKLQSMLEEQRAFASNTSHELRTPLTTIRLRSEAMRYDEHLDDATKSQYISEIDDEVRRLGALVEDLTLLSRFDAGRAELGASQIDMRRFASSMERQMLPYAQAREVRLCVRVPEGDAILAVYVGLNHLTVVFRNLLDNAIKYTPSGGEVEWFITSGVDGVTSIIKDNGQGIDAETLPHLFERFYRADKARSRDVPGTGLGLALVKSIVDAYGGTISIESAGLHHGTTVTVYLPARPVAQTVPSQ